jgi:hypothetical protein
MILQMVQDGTISPDEGGRLMEAMARAARINTPPPAPPAPPKATNVHILITNRRGEADVDLTLPIGVVDMGLKLASKFAPGRIPDLPEIRNSIRSGFTGKLLDIHNGTDRIEITIE